jgi:choline dehydrogenase-like flavoprotein
MTETDYDVVVVGSGAGGAMAAHTLTKVGKKVLMLEAGRDYDPVKETPMFNTARDAPLLGKGTPDKQACQLLRCDCRRRLGSSRGALHHRYG